MRKLFLLFVLAISLISNSQAEERRQEMSRYTMAYSGGEAYRVWIARFGPKESQEALVQISGIDHKLDGRVIRAKLVSGVGGSSVKYTATVDGQAYELLSVDGTKAVLRSSPGPAARPAQRVDGFCDLLTSRPLASCPRNSTAGPALSPTRSARAAAGPAACAGPAG